MKHIFRAALLSITASATLTACSDWLNLLPNNEQVTESYWQSKEDVEHVVAAGYHYMRDCVPTLITWGELRGGDFYNDGSGMDATKMQDFDMLPTNSLCGYSKFYQVISMANSVIKYAPEVAETDKTYYDAMMKSHLCEAYFQRAWAYSILVKNFKEVPLIVSAYVNDDAALDQPKASETQIIAQIKQDVQSALDTKAAKGYYEEEWQTKGRATKWALYALMADICLWNHEYDEAILYANEILNANDAMRPVFIPETSRWFEIFYPGLSNESIFELYWDYNTENSDNNFTDIFPKVGTLVGSKSGHCNFTEYAARKTFAETTDVLRNNKELGVDGRVGRMLNASYVPFGTPIYTGSTYGQSLTIGLWKYRGTDNLDASIERVHKDADFILYRVAEIMLIKAEALVMKGQSSWKSAIEIINTIRTRAGLPLFIDLESTSADIEIEALDEATLLTEVMDQREMEFLGEGKRWYDVLRLARYDKRFAPVGTVEDSEGIAYESYHSDSRYGEDQFTYKQRAIDMITEGNQTSSDRQLESVLSNSWAWYLPLSYSEIEINLHLEQNPYYE